MWRSEMKILQLTAQRSKNKKTFSEMPNRLDLFLNMLLAEVLLCDVFYFALFCFIYFFIPLSFMIVVLIKAKTKHKLLAEVFLLFVRIYFALLCFCWVLYFLFCFLMLCFIDFFCLVLFMFYSYLLFFIYDCCPDKSENKTVISLQTVRYSQQYYCNY